MGGREEDGTAAGEDVLQETLVGGKRHAQIAAESYRGEGSHEFYAVFQPEQGVTPLIRNGSYLQPLIRHVAESVTCVSPGQLIHEMDGEIDIVDAQGKWCALLQEIIGFGAVPGNGQVDVVLPGNPAQDGIRPAGQDSFFSAAVDDPGMDSCRSFLGKNTTDLT